MKVTQKPCFCRFLEETQTQRIQWKMNYFSIESDHMEVEDKKESLSFLNRCRQPHCNNATKRAITERWKTKHFLQIQLRHT